jgi:hypothetical protein
MILRVTKSPIRVYGLNLLSNKASFIEKIKSPILKGTGIVCYVISNIILFLHFQVVSILSFVAQGEGKRGKITGPVLWMI